MPILRPPISYNLKRKLKRQLMRKQAQCSSGVQWVKSWQALISSYVTTHRAHSTDIPFLRQNQLYVHIYTWFTHFNLKKKTCKQIKTFLIKESMTDRYRPVCKRANV